MWVVAAGETVEAPLVAGAWAVDASVPAASRLGETDSDVSEGDDVATAGEVTVAAAALVDGGGGGGGRVAVGSSVIGTGPDEDSWSWSRSEVPLGGVGGAVLEVQPSEPVAHAVVPALTGVDVTLQETSELSPNGCTTAEMPDSTTAEGDPPAAVFTVVVVTSAEVIARSGSCGDEAKCWVLAAAGVLVALSTDAAVDEDDAGEGTRGVSFPQAEGGLAAALISVETASDESLQDFGADVETTWTGSGEVAGAAAAGVEAGVVSELVVVVESNGAARFVFTLGGDEVVMATSGGAVELAAVGGGAGAEGQEAEGASDWAGRGGASTGGDVANGSDVVSANGSSVGRSGGSALLVLPGVLV